MLIFASEFDARALKNQIRIFFIIFILFFPTYFPKRWGFLLSLPKI